MAEWLRRLTRNQMGSSRVGSNPTRSDMNGHKQSKFSQAAMCRVQVFALSISLNYSSVFGGKETANEKTVSLNK